MNRVDVTASLSRCVGRAALMQVKPEGFPASGVLDPGQGRPAAHRARLLVAVCMVRSAQCLEMTVSRYLKAQQRQIDDLFSDFGGVPQGDAKPKVLPRRPVRGAKARKQGRAKTVR